MVALAKLAELAAYAVGGRGAKARAYLVHRLAEGGVFRVKSGRCREPDDMVECLKCIGEAVLKAEMKQALGRNRTDPGPDIHTWTLGLPRDNSQGGPSFWTGYFQVPKDRLKKCSGEVRHLPNTEAREEALAKPRMRSPLILFPVPGVIIGLTPRLCDEAGRSLLLEGVLARGERVLIHSGIHYVKIKSGHKTKNIPNLVRRIPVTDILAHREIPKACDKLRQQARIPHATECGGIALPGRAGAGGQASQDKGLKCASATGSECDAWQHTVELVKTLLTLKCASPG